MKCVSKDVCGTSLYCQGEAGGVYDDLLEGCFCNYLSDDPGSACDDDCKRESLEVYVTQDGKIQMVRGEESQELGMAEALGN